MALRAEDLGLPRTFVYNKTRDQRGFVIEETRPMAYIGDHTKDCHPLPYVCMVVMELCGNDRGLVRREWLSTDDIVLC